MQTIAATADRGYFAGEDIVACEAAGIVAFVPDAVADTCRCPNGETLSPHSESTTRGHRLLLYYNPAACRCCPLRAQCTLDKRWRRIAR